MSGAIDWFAGAWREFASRFRARSNEGPIDTVEKLAEFAATRSAFVSQKKLYGYVKTRMGTRYVSMFEDETFIASINIAKMHVFAACLSDLTIFCVARAASLGDLTAQQRESLADECHRRGIAQYADQAPSDDAPGEWAAVFRQRLADVHWENAAATGEVFEASPKALLRWAPIAPELKKYDAEIVKNSIRFAWNEVRMDYRARLDADGLRADLTSLAATGADDAGMS